MFGMNVIPLNEGEYQGRHECGDNKVTVTLRQAMERTIIDILGWTGTILISDCLRIDLRQKGGRRLVVVSRVEHHRRYIPDYQHVLSARIPIRGIEHRLGWDCVSYTWS